VAVVCYDGASAKSTCSAVTKDGKSCGVKLAGKNELI
jgi:hypothetical protein